MATFTKKNLTINNFMDAVTYEQGKGTDIKKKLVSNFYDSKLDFLNQTFTCSVYSLETSNYLPNIAVKFYGTSSLWWVIARFNGIIFPLKEIQVGTKLFIPELSEISRFLNLAQTKASSSSSKRIIL